ncbi:MAG TPA: hypothetical protein ENI19_02830 [Candidatus Nealsonbacteria bacterium]|uniref:Uncharacterized protein n=1 Tax=marine sediment metagenome TaxID=412755 RepID=A0A0F9WN98_9ZZZZ|nr:hypothetical protein [Candidatus Nealsonbacteria bacterium]HEB46617.1 hypothetical protein [Candidatus Nealsonbacteria bacterium]
MLENLALRTYDSLVEIWPGLVGGIINGIITLVFALIILFIGWLIALAVGQLVTRILGVIKFNQYIERAGIKEALDKAELKVDAAAFLGTIFKWIIFVVVLSVVAEILGLVQFAGLLQSILGYLPNVIVAVLIFVVSVIVAEILEKIVRAVVEGVKVGYGSLVGAIIKWSIWIFAILLILDQLRIGSDLIRILFAGIITMLAVAGGIAFGLGGKDVAAEILRDLKQKILK